MEVCEVCDWRLFAVLPSLLATGLLAQPSIQFVEVEPGVRLEVVDWGGTGRPVVLLAGLGDTAHVYDQFAPKLTPDFHVYGVTRRGFGASSVPNFGYTPGRLGDDVIRVLDALKLDHPVLVGHSIAGEELSAMGEAHPDRIAGLIYLDAAWDQTFSVSKESEERALKLGIPAAPTPVSTRFDPMQAVLSGVEKPGYARIRVPALAFYAVSRSWEELVPGAPAITDPAQRKLAEQVFADVDAVRKQMEDAFHSGVANSRVIELPGAGHYIFRSNEQEVLRGMRAFLDSLR